MPSLLKIKHPEVKICNHAKDECICVTCLYDCSECTECIRKYGNGKAEPNISCNDTIYKNRQYKPYDPYKCHNTPKYDVIRCY